MSAHIREDRRGRKERKSSGRWDSVKQVERRGRDEVRCEAERVKRGRDRVKGESGEGRGGWKNNEVKRGREQEKKGGNGVRV